MSVCVVCKGTGMVGVKDPDDTYPCGCPESRKWMTYNERRLYDMIHAFDTAKETT